MFRLNSYFKLRLHLHAITEISIVTSWISDSFQKMRQNKNDENKYGWGEERGVRVKILFSKTSHFNCPDTLKKNPPLWWLNTYQNCRALNAKNGREKLRMVTLSIGMQSRRRNFPTESWRYPECQAVSNKRSFLLWEYLEMNDKFLICNSFGRKHSLKRGWKSSFAKRASSVTSRKC